MTGMGLNLSVASWNINAAAVDRFTAQLRFLRKRGIDLALLQEVHRDRNTAAHAAAEGWSLAISSHNVPDHRYGKEGADHALGCMILGSDRVRLLGDAARLPDLSADPLPAPERTLTAFVEVAETTLTVASLYTVTGDSRHPFWGPAAKRETHAGWAAWMTLQQKRAVVGLDANAPRMDHPDVRRNGYWGDEYGFDYQHERLLFDPERAPHAMRDTLRRYLDEHPERRDNLLSTVPATGPLAVSFVDSRCRAYRYDYILVTPDIGVRSLPLYASEAIERTNVGRRLSDHAPILVDLELR